MTGAGWDPRPLVIWKTISQVSPQGHSVLYLPLYCDQVIPVNGVGIKAQ